MNWSAIAWVLGYMIVGCLLVASVTDLASRIIPNRLVLVVLCCGFSLRLTSPPGWFLASLLSAIAVFAALSLLAAYNLLGWGDVKLIAAVTLAVPPERVIPLLLDIVIAGGLLSCVYLAVRFALRRAASAINHPPLSHIEPEASCTRRLRWLARREGARILANGPMPYALAVLAGVAYSLTTE